MVLGVPPTEILRASAWPAPVGVFFRASLHCSSVEILAGQLGERCDAPGLVGKVGSACCSARPSSVTSRHIRLWPRWRVDSAQLHLMDGVGQIGLLLFVGITGCAFELRCSANARTVAGVGVGVGAAGFILPLRCGAAVRRRGRSRGPRRAPDSRRGSQFLRRVPRCGACPELLPGDREDAAGHELASRAAGHRRDRRRPGRPVAARTRLRSRYGLSFRPRCGRSGRCPARHNRSGTAQRGAPSATVAVAVGNEPVFGVLVGAVAVGRRGTSIRCRGWSASIGAATRASHIGLVERPSGTASAPPMAWKMRRFALVVLKPKETWQQLASGPARQSASRRSRRCVPDVDNCVQRADAAQYAVVG